MTSPQYDIARGSGAIDRCAYFLLRSPYTLCASAHPAKDFLLLQHGEISRAKMAKACEVSEILPFKDRKFNCTSQSILGVSASVKRPFSSSRLEKSCSRR
jgi:hypothetical protein